MNVKIWLENIDLYAPADVVKLLVGSKCDLTDERQIDYLIAKVCLL